MIAPCKDCTERKPACHSTCIAYKEYDEINKARRRQKVIDNAGLPITKNRKKKGQKGNYRYSGKDEKSI